jgi:hypothetical protein
MEYKFVVIMFKVVNDESWYYATFSDRTKPGEYKVKPMTDAIKNGDRVLGWTKPKFNCEGNEFEFFNSAHIVRYKLYHE